MCECPNTIACREAEFVSAGCPPAWLDCHQPPPMASGLEFSTAAAGGGWGNFPHEELLTE
jgi:hypothetical protein